MKKLFAILVATVAVALCMVSCQKTFDPSKGLNGTTWVATQVAQTSSENITVTYTLSFQETTFKLNTSYTYDGQAHSENQTGTYTLNGYTVTLQVDQMTEVGTISGSKMTFEGENENLVFTMK